MKQVFVPEVLVGINDFHGSFERRGKARLNLLKCTRYVNKVYAFHQSYPHFNTQNIVKPAPWQTRRNVISFYDATITGRPE
jgi:hypothetical protein